MPFCSQCGNPVAGADAFCSRCGARQPTEAGRPTRANEPLSGINPHTASILCYLPGVGWIASIVELAVLFVGADLAEAQGAAQAQAGVVLREYARHQLPEAGFGSSTDQRLHGQPPSSLPARGAIDVD